MSDSLTAALALVRQTAEEQQRAIEALQIANEAGQRQLHALQASLDAWHEQIDALQVLGGMQDAVVTQPAGSADEDGSARVRAVQATVDAQRATIDALELEAEAARQQRDLLASRLSSEEEDLNYKTALTLTLANAAYDALMVVDENYEVIAINDAAEVLFDRVRPLHEKLIDVTGSPEIESVVQDALAYQEESFEEQVTLNKRVYRVRAQMIRRAGNSFVALALQDISELVRLNRARRDMVANISHELRTPVANIRIIIESLFHEQDKPKRKESTTALRSIARETDTLLWLVQELLDLSMIESGQAILRMVEVPADLLVDEAVERLVDQSDTKDLKITPFVPSDIQVLCDRDQARRVLINLIHNAIKWSPVGGTIRVEVTPNNDDVTFAVLDEGPGVNEEFTERIFERFYQVDPSRSAGEGSGLGLAICKHIVEAHGGRIWAESNANGGGGRFLFTLPRADERIGDASTSEFA